MPLHLDVFLRLRTRTKLPRHTAEVLRAICVFKCSAIEINVTCSEATSKLPLPTRVGFLPWLLTVDRLAVL